MSTVKRLTNIDLLKFIASLCIALHHYQQRFDIYFEKGLNFSGGIIPFGYLVELFFIISGFLVARSKKNETFIKNISKRWLRLFPYAFLATLSSYIVFLTYNTVIGSAMLDRSYSVPCVITSLLMIHQGWIIEYIGVNNPIWYLCVLMWLYIVYYAIKEFGGWIDNKIKKGYLVSILFYCGFVILGMGIRFLHMDLPFLHESNGRGYTAFFIGVLLYHVTEKLTKKRMLITGTFLLVSGIVSVLMRLHLALSLTILVYPGFLLLLLNTKQINCVYVGSLGDVSFEIFIWHVPLYNLIYFLMSVAQINILNSYSVMLLSLIVVIGISFVIHYFVDIPLSVRINKLAKSTTGG